MAASLSNPAIQQSVSDLDRNLKISLTQVLADCYGEGFVKAAEALEAKPHITREDSDLLKQDVERLVKPIYDYNHALGDKISEIVKDGFASGKDDLQVAADLRRRIPDILNNEPVTIQRPGKRPVSFTAEGYAEMVAGIIPYSVRGNGYVRGLEEAGADGWEWVATGNERMCEVCGDKHGQVFGFDTQFELQHPGCKCRPVAWFKPKTKEEEAESERIKEAAGKEPWAGTPKDEQDKPETKAQIADQLVEPIYPKKYAYPGSTIERPKLEHKELSMAESQTISKFVELKSNPYVEGHDPLLEGLAKEAGFDGLPKSVSNDELDKIVLDGHKELFRGLSEKRFADQFAKGSYFGGKGVDGNGTYTAFGENGFREAKNYAGKSGVVVRMALDKDAIVKSVDDIYDLKREVRLKLDNEIRTTLDALASTKSDSEKLSLQLKLDSLNGQKLIIQDPGRFAVLYGIDAIEVPSSKYLIVLNRAALYVVSETV